MLEYQFSIYMLPTLFSAAVSFGLAVFMYRRRSMPGAKVFLVMMVLAGIWSAAYLLVIAARTRELKLFWFNIAQIGPAFVPVLWLLLVRAYTGSKRWVWRRGEALLFAVPAVGYLLMWTNGYHHLVREAVQLEQLEFFTYLEVDHGPWFLVEVSYSYAVMLASLFVLIRAFSRVRVKGQIIVLLASFLLPLLSNVLDVFGLNPLRPFGPTSLTFTISGLIIAFGLFRFQLFDVVPIARDKLFNKLVEPLLVLDDRRVLIDLNTSAEELFGGGTRGPVGRRIEDFAPQLAALFASNKDASMEYDCEDGRSFEAKKAILRREHLPQAGSLIILRDITERKRQEEALRKAYDEKAALLRELQHRVKNSMSSILSFVRIEYDRNKSPEVGGILRNLEHRIFAFSKLYDLLNRSADGSHIRLDEYIPQVVHTLRRSFEAEAKGIVLSVEVDELQMGPKNAAALGLIVNELLTNSLKYAFQDREFGSSDPEPRGKIAVSLKKEAETILLSFSDDGPGLPRDFNKKGTGVGMNLVEILVQQLEGKMTIDSQRGARFSIEMPAWLPD
ncbi:MAG TPA: hypothetical protein ENN41_01910 [Sediminispirochaeta sp.]|nr:hypothetical protein [Sediminispirochaeta sp.]